MTLGGGAAAHRIVETTEIVVLDEPRPPAFLEVQANRAQTDICKGVDKEKGKNDDISAACLGGKFTTYEEGGVSVCRGMGDIN